MRRFALFLLIAGSAAILAMLAAMLRPKTVPRETVFGERVQPDGKAPPYKFLQNGTPANEANETNEANEEEHLLALYPDFASAAKAFASPGGKVLPSINAAAAKARQFDDGMRGAIEVALAMGTGRGENFDSALKIVRAIAAKLGRDSEAFAFLYASLEAGGFATGDLGAQPKGADAYTNAFIADPTQSKPVSFYTWTPELQQTFRFTRFLQQRFRDRSIAEGIARVFLQNQDLLQRYQRLLAIYAKLDCPLKALTPADLAGKDTVDMSLAEIWIKKNIGGRNSRTGIYFLPYSIAPEALLAERMLGGENRAAGAGILEALVKAIRDGKPNLAPLDKQECGWRDYEVYSLQALLVPTAGERGKLDLHPQARVEPAPDFFLCHARTYTFLQRELIPLLGSNLLHGAHGFKDKGRRDENLMEELAAMRRLFYGLHLIACEDLGLRPQTLPNEVADPDACRQAAANWLEHWTDDPDLAADARTSVPIHIDPQAQTVQLWNIIGVRGIKLEASHSVLLAGEVAIITRKSLTVLSREELRCVCDREKTREAIIEGLQH